MRRALSAVGLVVFMFGCGGGDELSIEATVDTVCDEIAEVVCHNLYSCCTEGEIQDYLDLTEPRSEDECRQDVRRSCERSTATLQYAVAKGTVHFDSNVMNTCLRSLAAPDGTCASVVDEIPWSETCVEPSWTGVVPVEGDCEFSFECANAPDAFCAANQKCEARPGHGQPCGSGCSSTTYCSLGVCQPRLPAGGLCDSTSQCEEDLFCDTSEAMPTCKARGVGGEACTSGNACESGQCIPGTCAGPVASSCYEDDDCTSRCADDNSPCSTAASCATGTCMLSGFSCSSPTSCGGSDTCIFPVACVPGDCLGEPVCRAAQYTIDYCEDPLAQLPSI